MPSPARRVSSSDCQRPRPILPSTTGRKLIAQRQGNQVDVGIARFIRRHTRAQVEMVVEPGALWCCQLKRETLDVSQQALLVLVEGQSSGGVLSRGDQQAVADPTAIDQSLQVRRDVMAAEGAGRLQMEAVMQVLGHRRGGADIDDHQNDRRADRQLQRPACSQLA